MSTPVIIITSPSGDVLTFEQLEKERILADQLRLAKNRVQNSRILTATVETAGNTAIAFAKLAGAAAYFPVELGMAAYTEYMPSSQQIFHWLGSSLPAIPELPTLTVPELPTLPEIQWNNPLTPTIAC